MDEGKSGMMQAVGTMSGTSLDGVDAAVLVSDGVQIADFGPAFYRPYSKAERAVLRAALGHWPGTPEVAAAAQVVTAAHGELLARFDTPALVGFHGQTLAHDPAGRGTHQTGDAQALADKLGVPVMWDFRSADVAAGGQGAPFAPVYHWALARWMKADAPIGFLNMGGVGNLTWVDPLAADPFAPGALLAFDTGPANAPLNDLVSRRKGWAYDEGGALAAAGTADIQVVRAALTRPFINTTPPKSLDRDDFAGLLDDVADLPDADAAATLVAVAAQTVAKGLPWCPSMPAQLLVTGGGRLNVALMAALRDAVPCAVAPVEDAGLNGDMLEAQAFAYLALRSAKGLPLSGPGTTGVPEPCLGGQCAHPQW